MIIDRLLQDREQAGNPIRVGMIGAGAMGRTIARQILRYTAGMRLVAIANRTVSRASDVYHAAGAQHVATVSSVSELEDTIGRGAYAVTDDPRLVAEAGNVDVILEVTGTIHYAAETVLHAIAHGKNTVLMNAELEGTIGAILRTRADEAGVIFSGCDGDQPGLEMNLFRYVRSIGLTPLVCGNVKGLQDPYRTPETQAAFAQQWHLSPELATSAADGTKINFEQATVANAVGFGVARRGMNGFEFPNRIEDVGSLYDVDELLDTGGIVDYVVGADPRGGVYVLGTVDDPEQERFLGYYKLGDGPLYCFYTPYHLCHFEIPISIARVALFGDTVIAPKGAPSVDVVAVAKRDLRRGETLDGMGGFMTYGQAENYAVSVAENLLPMGLAEGCRLSRDVEQDSAITYADVDVPEGRLGDALRDEQNDRFAFVQSARGDSLDG